MFYLPEQIDLPLQEMFELKKTPVNFVPLILSKKIDAEHVDRILQIKFTFPIQMYLICIRYGTRAEVAS